MNWLKKNLFLVVGGIVILALLGLAGYYLNTQRNKDSEISTKLAQEISGWKTLVNLNPSANEENISAAQEEFVRLTKLLEDTKEHFTPSATYTNLDVASFKALLENTLFELTQMAEDQGVTLPPEYTFTTKSLRQQVQFPPGDLIPLANQLAELRELCKVLFEARIHTLYSLRRVVVSTNDRGAANFLSGKSVKTNAVTQAVVTPYEVAFYGFTPELAAVLRGLQASSNCFVVKNVSIKRAQGAATSEMPTTEMGGFGDSAVADGGVQPGAIPGQTAAQRMQDRYGVGGGAASRMQDRYGRGGGGASPQSRYGGDSGISDRMRSRYGLGPTTPRPTPTQPVGTAPRPASQRPETVLDGQLLSITLYLEAIRSGSAPVR